MRIPFKTDRLDGKICVMDLEGINPSEIQFNLDTREIFVVYEPAVDYESMSWRDLKALVIENGGEYVNKAEAIAFLQEVGK